MTGPTSDPVTLGSCPYCGHNGEHWDDFASLCGVCGYGTTAHPTYHELFAALAVLRDQFSDAGGPICHGLSSWIGKVIKPRDQR